MGDQNKMMADSANKDHFGALFCQCRLLRRALEGKVRENRNQNAFHLHFKVKIKWSISTHITADPDWGIMLRFIDQRKRFLFTFP